MKIQAIIDEETRLLLAYIEVLETALRSIRDVNLQPNSDITNNFSPSSLVLWMKRVASDALQLGER